MTIACIISFIVGTLAMMCAIGLMSYQKDKKPRNKVRLYVTCTDDVYGKLVFELWLLRPTFQERYKIWYANRNAFCICREYQFHLFNLNPDDFSDMKIGEIREVFINLED